MISGRWKSSGAALLLGLALASPARGAPRIDVTELARETQRVFQDGQTIQMVWWIPAELWTQWAAAGGFAGKQGEFAVGTLRTHTVLFVAEGAISPLGGMKFAEPAALLGRVHVLDAKGRSRPALAEDQIPADVSGMVAGIGPALGRALGPAGEHMYAFVFGPDAESGAALASGGGEGVFTVEIDARKFEYRLPLSALVPPKRCPVDGELLSGTFQFCPYHGAKLEPAPDAAPAPTK